MSPEQSLEKSVKDNFDPTVKEFVSSHRMQILQQLKEDKEYQLGVSELPVIPVFNQFLIQLKSQIEQYLFKHHYPKDVAERVANKYEQTFYYYSLPNISEYALTHR